MEEKKCLLCFVVPFFGKLPDTMPFFLKTCADNPDYNWLLLTDDKTNYGYPDNVTVKYCSFDNIKKRIQSVFDFEISIERAMRLCSFKPAYGYIFSEELKDYEYWGYCDLDQFFGNINNFLSAEFMRQYDKLFCLGHLTIYRNTEEINSVFKNTARNENLRIKSYVDIFKGADIAFDEWPEDCVNINILFDEAGLKSYYGNQMLCDVVPYISRFEQVMFNVEKMTWELAPIKNFVFIYKNGQLYKVSKSEMVKSYKYEEILYVHLQKRKMVSVSNIQGNNNFLIYPNKIISFISGEEDKLLKKCCRQIALRRFFRIDEVSHYCTTKINLLKYIIVKHIFRKEKSRK